MLRKPIFGVLTVDKSATDGHAIIWRIENEKLHLHCRDGLTRDVHTAISNAIPQYYQDQGVFLEAERRAENGRVISSFTLVVPTELENDDNIHEIVVECQQHCVRAVKITDNIGQSIEIPPEMVTVRSGDTESYGHGEYVTYPLTSELVKAFRRNVKGRSGIFFTALIAGNEYEITYAENSQPIDDMDSTFELVGSVDGITQSRTEVLILCAGSSKLSKFSYAEDQEVELVSSMYHGKSVNVSGFYTYRYVAGEKTIHSGYIDAVNLIDDVVGQGNMDFTE